ncbi:MAG: prepilin-type N-terminal cleavage/methylation domain-containing protein [Nitrosomonadales bacterium]|nr:prepilin-type N-terminal cleavage/methylation domain-containing protein [Nitrosomonadales bacterium]
MSAANHNTAMMRGFTMVEVLVALLIFWLGLMGIAMYTAAGLKVSAINQVRATVIKAGSVASEPMSYHTRADCLAAMLATYPKTVTVDDGKDSYPVSLVSAIDGSGTSVATGTTAATTVPDPTGASWVSPVTITLRVPYTGVNGATVTATPTYTLVLQSYTVACNA